jgi:hypothetical protein
MEHQYTPPELNFINSELSIEDRHAATMALLTEYQCIIEFTKVNGEDRSMQCTLREDLLPIQGRLLAEDVVEAHQNTINHELITVWSTEANGWRAMRTKNIKSVKLAPLKWTITVEEDPETGETILPLPEDMLKLQGWKEGDTLTWTDNNDGSWALSKKDDTDENRV